MRARILAALVLLMVAGPAAADELRHPYLVADETVFVIAEYPVFFDIVSILPDRPPAALQRDIAREALCYFADHPAVRSGAVPFGGPVTVRFYQLTREDAGLLQAMGWQMLAVATPFATVTLDAVHCEGA